MTILNRIIFSGILKNQTISLQCPIRYNHIKPKTRITSYLLNKYVSFVKSYEGVLKKKFPAAVKFYQVFSVGLKDFKNDVTILCRAFTKCTSAGGLSSLSRKELEIYHQMPKDIVRTAPVMFIGAVLPFGGVIFIIAYYFPKFMLTHHFWSLQQRSEFSLSIHKRKLKYFKPVFRCMQSRLCSLNDHPLYKPLSEVLGSLGSGIHPNLELILSCKDLFEKDPFGLNFLSRNHIVGLLNLYGMHKGWRRKTRLYNRANLIKLMDVALIREGGLDKLTQDEIKWNCFFRGLNPINMKQEDILKWLKTWLQISEKVDAKTYSLLLHCPILLGYNQPSNWWLLHDRRRKFQRV